MVQRFGPELLTKKPTSGIDIETTLHHFAIITYMIEVDKLSRHIHQRFKPYSILLPDGNRKALLSVVPFLDYDFRLANFPWVSWDFAQTNYRAYVTDTETGENVVWFFGTSLDSWTVNIPRLVWKLPWHRAQIRFDVQYDRKEGRYEHYRLQTDSQWAKIELELSDTGNMPDHLLGFTDLESGLVLLTHPLKGYFYRRDGQLGNYSIWYDRLQPTVGYVERANFSLLESLGLVVSGDLSDIHSVLIQPEIDFTIYLPPTSVVSR